MKNILLIFLFSCVAGTVPCQTANLVTGRVNDCSGRLKEADQLYQGGFYEKCIIEIESILRSCNLSRGEKEHSMELLAKTYVESNDIGSAESAVSAMLKSFPHYELKETENPEVFNRLVKKFKVHPLISVGIRNTALWTKFNTTSVFTIPGGTDNKEPYIKKGFAFMYYGWGEIEFDKGISLNGDLIFRLVGYDRYIQLKPDQNFNFWEWQNLLEIPVYLKKYFYPGKNILTYVTAGAGWSYMIKSDGNINLYNSTEKTNTIINNIDLLPMRHRNTYEWLAGAGIGYKLKNLRLFLDARYYGGLNSFTNPSKRLSNPTLNNDFYYVDNSVKMNQFEIGASISYTLINSVKKIKY